MPPNHPPKAFQAALRKARQGNPPDRRDLTVLLAARAGVERDALFAAARGLAEAGVHLIDLTMGEDPALYTEDAQGFDALVDLVAAVRSAAGLPVMVSPGVVPDRTLQKLAAARATWYACYQETHNPERFRRLRPRQNYTQRMDTKQRARGMGLLVEEGLLCGIGETNADLVESIRQMRAMDVDKVRAMTFIPQPQTPLQDRPDGLDEQELITMAVMCLVFPERLIPASLDVRGLDGLRDRLRAGANVVTSIVPPDRGLAGAANRSLDIEPSRRTCARVHDILAEESLQTANQDTYEQWVADRQSVLAAKGGTIPGQNADNVVNAAMGAFEGMWSGKAKEGDPESGAN